MSHLHFLGISIKRVISMRRFNYISPLKKRKKKNKKTALAGVAQWIECQPMNQRVAGSIPSQGKCLGCRPGPQ